MVRYFLILAPEQYLSFCTNIKMILFIFFYISQKKPNLSHVPCCLIPKAVCNCQRDYKFDQIFDVSCQYLKDIDITFWSVPNKYWGSVASPSDYAHLILMLLNEAAPMLSFRCFPIFYLEIIFNDQLCKYISQTDVVSAWMTDSSEQVKGEEREEERKWF